MQIEVPVGAEILARKVFAIGLGHQPLQLLVAQLLELLGRDGLADAKAPPGKFVVHHSPASPCLKQPAVWSSTMPTACIQA